MLNLLHQYILVWQLPVALVIASMAIVAVRTAYRKLRIGDLDILDHGAVEQSFTASLWVGMAAIVYPCTFVFIVGVWIAFIYRHLMSVRAWLASLLALTLCGFWYYLICHYL